MFYSKMRGKMEYFLNSDLFFIAVVIIWTVPIHYIKSDNWMSTINLLLDIEISHMLFFPHTKKFHGFFLYAAVVFVI